MTWAKVSDGFNDDPRLVECSRGARLLLVEMTVHACKHLTDGRVTRAAVARITDEPDPDAALAELALAGLIERPPDGSIFLVDFPAEQPSAEQVHAQRADVAKRKARSRAHLKGDHSLCLDPASCAPSVTRDSVTTVTRDQPIPVTPARPDPTRPVPARRAKGRVGGDQSAPRRGGRNSRPPDPPGPTCPHGRPFAPDNTSTCRDGLACDQARAAS